MTGELTLRNLTEDQLAAIAECESNAEWIDGIKDASLDIEKRLHDGDITIHQAFYSLINRIQGIDTTKEL